MFSAEPPRLPVTALPSLAKSHSSIAAVGHSALGFYKPSPAHPVMTIFGIPKMLCMQHVQDYWKIVSDF